MNLTHLKAKTLFQAGEINHAWDVAQQDDGLNADVTKEEWVAWMFKLVTGLQFDPDGPAPDVCEHCGRVFQYVPDHDCPGKRMECRAAAAHESNYR
jgi:hypothetical protein